MAYGYGPPPRQASQAIQTEDERRRDYEAKVAEWERLNPAPLTAAQEAARVAGVASPNILSDFFQNQAQYNTAWNDPTVQSAYKTDYDSNLANIMTSGGTASDAAFINNNETLNSFGGYDYGYLVDKRQQALDGMSREFQTGLDYTRQNEERQKQAYQQQIGGGFAGGIIDESYSDPFSNQISGARSMGGLGGLGGMAAPNDPTMSNVDMPWQQPWSTPGFGQPGQGSSQGVGSYSPNNGQQQGATGSTNPQASQWGGVFGAKNPWSPA